MAKLQLRVRWLQMKTSEKTSIKGNRHIYLEWLFHRGLPHLQNNTAGLVVSCYRGKHAWYWLDNVCLILEVVHRWHDVTLSNIRVEELMEYCRARGWIIPASSHILLDAHYLFPTILQGKSQWTLRGNSSRHDSPCICKKIPRSFLMILASHNETFNATGWMKGYCWKNQKVGPRN